MVTRIQKLLWLLVACGLMLTGCGAPMVDGEGESLPPAQSQTQGSQTPTRQNQTILLPYDPNGGMNPYTTKAQQNFYLCGLLYDSLTTLSPTYEAENRLAAEITLDGTTCTILLREDATFWDGTPVTAADVAYSLSLAMQSGYYGAGLTGVASFAVDPTDSRKLMIELSQPDRFFACSLVFPVVKSDTGADALPIGSGRYLADLSALEMRPNPNHFSGGAGKPFKLVELTDNDALNYGVKAGTIDYLFTDMRASWNKSYGSSYRVVQLNNMVYLGLKGTSGITADPAIRRVFYELLQRQDVVDKAYMGFAVPAYLPINPAFVQAPYTAPAQLASAELLGDRLDEMGYGNRDSFGYRTDRYNRRLSLQLLINSESSYKEELARLLVQGCDQLGIEITVQRLPYSQYLQKLQEGSFDLYIGEVKLPYNMDSTAMLSGMGQTGYGIVSSQELLQAYADFRQSAEGFTTFEEIFYKEVPFVPLVFRRGVVLFSANFSSNIVATEQDIFYNIKDW